MDLFHSFATNTLFFGSGHLIDKDREEIDEIKNRSTLIEARFQIIEKFSDVGIVLIVLLFATGSSRTTGTTRERGYHQ